MRPFVRALIPAAIRRVLRCALGGHVGVVEVVAAELVRLQSDLPAIVRAQAADLAGTALGVLAAVGYSAYQGWPSVIPLTSVVVGCLGAVAVGMVAGVYPSVRAARLPPTEALASA